MDKYSPSTGGIYPKSLLNDYIQSGTLPNDLVDITEEEKIHIFNGEILTIQNDGKHLWSLPEPSLSEVKTLKISELTSKCSSEIIGGCSSEALGSSYIYPTKEIDQMNLSANVFSSLLPNFPEDWTTLQICCDSNGNWDYLSHTAEQIQKVGNDVKDFILNCRTRYKSLCDKVEKASTIEAVQAITW